jgi:hypothetical protein
MKIVKKIFVFLDSFLENLISSVKKAKKQIPKCLIKDFTLNNAIQVNENYINDTYSKISSRIYSKKMINELFRKAEKRECNYYGLTDKYLYDALDVYKDQIKDKRIGILGSVLPWYECIILKYGGNPITLDYNKRYSLDSRIKTMTLKQYLKNPIKFDVILSISSFEHDGLGRYGDPINPQGDLIAMDDAKKMLKKNGLLFLAVPVGLDCVVWNAHRIYGEIRLPMLLKKWDLVESFGFSEKKMNSQDLGNYKYQPIFVLK